MFKVKTNKSVLKVIEREPLASGASKIYGVTFTFDSEWDGLVKTAIFKAGEISISVLIEKDYCDVPWEVLARENINEFLWIGVFGADKTGIILPTIWNQLGVIQPGAELSESGKNPTPAVVAQIYAAAKGAEEKADQAALLAASAQIYAEEAKGYADQTENILTEVTNTSDAILTIHSMTQSEADRAEEAEAAAALSALAAEKAAEKAGILRRITANNLKTAMTAHKKVFEHASPNKAMELIHGGCVELDGRFFKTDYCYYTNKIAVSAGETITYQATSIEDDERSIVRITNVTAYDAEDNVLADLGATEVYSYVVPEGVAYIICSIFADDVDKYFEWAIAASDTVIPCSYILKPSAIPYLGNNYSNALRGAVFGETVSVSDVSPIEHDLRVKVNSKNLFHFVKDTNATSNGLKITAVANTSSFTVDGTSTNSSISGYPFPSMLLPPGTYTLSISDVPFSDKEGADRIHINGKNPLTGSAEVLAYIYFSGTQKRTTFTITETWEVFVNFLFSPGRTWENQEFTVQLEKGTEASGYAPYVDVTGVNITLSDGENEQTATSDADGNVTGLISASPSMTLTSDTENVIIECEYNRDLMKVIEELTQAIISLGGNI